MNHEDFMKYAKAEQLRASIRRRTATDPKEKREMKRREKNFARICEYFDRCNKDHDVARSAEVRG